jgi:hypothetical protein
MIDRTSTFSAPRVLNGSKKKQTNEQKLDSSSHLDEGK